jgi:hypothetical protein
MIASDNLTEIVNEKEQKSNMFSFVPIGKTIYLSAKTFFELFGIYLFWVVLHYICSNMYASWCTPYTIFGFILSPFVSSAPHCTAFRWVITSGGNIINTMWITLGSWFAKKMII